MGKMAVVYVAGPYRGMDSWETERNVRQAEELGYAVAVLGAMPLIPHTNTRFFDGTRTHTFWIDGTLELMRRCDAVVLTERWRASVGARGEVREANRLDIPVFENIEGLRLWLDEREAAQ